MKETAHLGEIGGICQDFGEDCILWNDLLQQTENSHFWVHTMTGSVTTGCGCAEVAVGSFQYAPNAEVGNVPGAVYAVGGTSPAVAATAAWQDTRTRKEQSSNI